MRAEIREKDDRIAKLEEDNQEKDDRIAKLEEDNQEKDNRIAELEESDVCVAPYALGTKATHGYMGSSAGSGLLNWGIFDQENTNDNEIRAVSFRNWLAGLDADVHVFKLEAMGIELELLECARDLLQAGRIKHLLTYAHDGRFDKLMQLLPTLGFVPDSKLAYDSKPGVRGIIAASWAPVGQRLRYE